MKTNHQRKIKNTVEMDRISLLPDSILTLILSFLDTKTVVRTSVLSKRWTLVWTSLPNLDFKVVRPKSLRHFSFFVNHVLTRRDDSQLVKFRLSLHDQVAPSLIQDCLTYAAHHKVTNLRMCACTCTDNIKVSIPTALLSSQYLEVLKLNCVIRDSIALPRSWSFPNLKYLKLKNFVFSDDNFDDGKIFSGCPKVESVILCKCAIRDGGKLKELEMKCLELKNFEISHWRSHSKYYELHRINVISPKLSSFVFKGYVAKVCFKEDLSCLDSVCVDLRYPKWNATQDRKRWTGECFMTMIGKFCNVRSLSLSMDTIEALSAIRRIHDHGPFTFGNLRLINFVTEDKASLMTIPINIVAEVLKHNTDGSLVFNVFEDNKLSVRAGSSHPDRKKSMKDKNITDIPIHLMSYLLEIAPCAESLTVEFAKASCEGVGVEVMEE